DLSQAIKQDNECVDSYIIEEKISSDIITQNNNKFSFSGRADRIDILQDGSLRIIDYKTGKAPSKTNVRSGKEPQLGLTAYALKNKYKNISDLNYWEIKKDFKSTTNIDKNNQNISEISYEKLCEQVDLYADINTPYYYEKANSKYNDYEHLFRQNEWGLKSNDVEYDNE
ncbi:PD-(D/E)XK nuclease family protein, partial [Alphaproteobacteria bacterium]|nr:PD-(D/E)XK nuclease family protein [Alphaproteobacteria bacterium]MDB2404992.1 PD-(D/E)XK nuclease family protein [Alphaproteobacteria bacterium]